MLYILVVLWQKKFNEPHNDCIDFKVTFLECRSEVGLSLSSAHLSAGMKIRLFNCVNAQAKE